MEDFRVLMALLEQLDYENLITTNQAEIARELDMQRQNVQRSIKRLMALGVLLRGRRSALAAPTGSTRSSVGVERQEPHRHAGSGAQKANGEGRDQGRDRGRPASPAASPRARPGHAGHVRRLRPPEQHQGSDVLTTHCCAMHVRNSEVCTFETAKCARSKQRSAHVRNSEVRTYDLLRKSVLRSFRMRKARLVVSPKPREARADQERFRRPSGAFATWQAAGEKHPSHQPGAWGRSWASRPSCCAKCCASLDPIHSGSALRPPARASGAFFE